MFVKAALVPKIFVLVTFVRLASVAERLVVVTLVTVMEAPVAEVKVTPCRFEVPVTESCPKERVVPVAPPKMRLFAKRFVLVTLAKLASVAERLVEVTETAERPSQRKLAVPRKYVASVPGRKSPVDVPPANWMVDVVTLPWSVTC